MRAEPVALGTVAIIGGGCYGSFYAKQLRSARERGALRARRVLIVDRDPECRAVREGLIGDQAQLVPDEWSTFLDGFLESAGGSVADSSGPVDAIVPSPFMPHLMAEWLLRRAQTCHPDRAARLAKAVPPAGTPYDRLGPDGNRYLSFADWLCPVHCVEPALCPVIRGPRTWEMSELIEVYARQPAFGRSVVGAATFVTRHRAYGVGMIDAVDAARAVTLLGRAATRAEATGLLVATVSACHGAVVMLELDPVPPA